MPNASSTVFGYEFQSNAAIVLMLSNIEHAVSIRVEGKTEDIEISLDNGNTIYSQAKAVVNPMDYSNVRQKMKDGLSSLNIAATNGSIEKLIYITNSPNPFNNANTIPLFYGFSPYDFASLPDECQSAINDIKEKNSLSSIDLNKLGIYVLPFSGDGENRYKVIKEKIYEFLHLIGIDASGLGKEILDLWQHYFAINASQQDLTRSITKKQMIWPIIVSKCEVGRDELSLANFDEGQVDEISRIYHDIICNNSERFEFIAKVIADYNTYNAPINENKIKSFLENHWSDFQGEFFLENVCTEIAEAVIKLTICKVINTRYIVARIKGAINL